MNAPALATTSTDLLCGPARTSLVAAALDLPAEAAVSARIDRLQRRSDGLSVGYDVTYPSNGQLVRDYLVASTAPVALAASGMARLQHDGVNVALWRHPADPALPGLGPACDLETVAGWLPGARGLEVVTYRPLRRAVIRVRLVGGAQSYLKVVRPGHVDALRQRHALLEHLGAPRVLAHPGSGVLVLSEVAGPTLGAAIAAGDKAPTLAAIEALLDAIPAEAVDLSAVAPWTSTLSEQVLLAPAGGADRLRLQRLSRELSEAILSTGADLPIVATHGDLHGGNLIVGPRGGITGVLDVDRLGPGRRIDDLACLIGHTSLAGALDPSSAGAESSAQAQVWWRDAPHPAALAPRVAAVMVSLVAVLRPGQVTTVLDHVERWLDRALR